MKRLYMIVKFAYGDSRRNRGTLHDLSTESHSIQLVKRMRNATILVVRLRGVATETIKNIVLAGIGKLIIVDDEDVDEEDLGAGFFFTEDDVSKKVN
jgi:ubiquitin-like 1-activating enzyme E1 A